MNYLFEILRYATMMWNSVWRMWAWYWMPEDISPVRQYYLGAGPVLTEHTVVPPGQVYVEDWMEETGRTRHRVLYEGETIPRVWQTRPLAPKPRRPWIWVGDQTTEIDLTGTFDRYLIVGNRITMALVRKLIQVTDETDLIYIDRVSFDNHEFPGDGIVIGTDE